MLETNERKRTTIKTLSNLQFPPDKRCLTQSVLQTLYIKRAGETSFTMHLAGLAPPPHCLCVFVCVCVRVGEYKKIYKGERKEDYKETKRNMQAWQVQPDGVRTTSSPENQEWVRCAFNVRERGSSNAPRQEKKSGCLRQEKEPHKAKYNRRRLVAPEGKGTVKCWNFKGKDLDRSYSAPSSCCPDFQIWHAY